MGCLLVWVFPAVCPERCFAVESLDLLVWVERDQHVADVGLQNENGRINIVKYDEI